MPTHAEKNRGRRVLFPLKRANIAAFGLYDRAAGHAVSGPSGAPDCRDSFVSRCRITLVPWSGPRPGGLALRLRDSWGTEVRGWSSLALGGVG
jgi:hypothetical protein